MDTIESKPNPRQVRRRHPRRRRHSAGWEISDGVLAVVVVGSALAIGTVHIPTLLVIATLALVGGTLAARELRSLPWPAVVLAGLGLFSAAQAIPLPAAWVNRVSPVSADVWIRCLMPFGETAPRNFPFSLDAGGSIAESLKWLTDAWVYVMATRMRARRGSAFLGLLLFGSAVLVTLVTLGHGVADLDVLYGVYHPDFAVGRWSVGPLLNSNNLAGYAILGLFSGAGLLLSDRSPVPRLPVIVGLGAISCALCLSGSRAGVLCVLIFGVAALGWVWFGQRVRFSVRTAALGMAPFVIGIGVAVALGTVKDARQLASLDVQRKVSVWLWSLPMIRDHVLFGVGRGAFETAFPPYRQALDYDWGVVFTHAENFVVQWIAEWGVPVGLGAVVAVVGYVLKQWYGSRNERLRFMVMTGLVALFTQNLADLGLEVPSLAIAAVLALGAGERFPRNPVDESTKPLGWSALIASVPAFALCVAAWAWARSPVELERRELSAAYQQLAIKSSSERAQFRSSLRAAILRHPGESYFPLLGALVAMRTADDSALRWVARALELEPMSGRAHLALAQLLDAHGATTQAMLHLRLATQYDRTLAGVAGAHASRWSPSVDVLMQAIPEGPYGESMLLEACSKKAQGQQQVDCSRRAALAQRHSAEAQQALGDSLLRAIQAGQPPCNGTLLETCTTEAEVALKAAQKLEPQSWQPSYLLSKVLLARGDTLAAAGLLARICPSNADGEACWRDAVVAAIKSGSHDTISDTATSFAARPCGSSESCADHFDWLASHLASGEQHALANTFYTKAAEVDSSAARWLRVAEHAADAHFFGVALRALERADRCSDSSVSDRAHAELLRQNVARAAAGRPE